MERRKGDLKDLRVLWMKICRAWKILEEGELEGHTAGKKEKP